MSFFHSKYEYQSGNCTVGFSEPNLHEICHFPVIFDFAPIYLDGEIQNIMQGWGQLSGISGFAPGNAALLQPVIVQYLPVIMTLSKLTEFLIGLLQNCV